MYGTAAGDDALGAAFRAGDVPVAVYGLGKMGLPLAAAYADVCGDVVGADVDPEVVAAVNDGDCHVTGEPGLPELVGDLSERGALRATDSPAEAASEASWHVVIVPTPVTEDRDPDLSILDAVVDEIAGELDPGDTVVVECTVPPRTCRERVLPALESGSGLERGEFGLAFCPERTLSGRALEDITGTHPKVVGGVDDESTRVARVVYDQITDNRVIPVGDAATAEAVKVFEGLYRDVNIALANELARFADETGVDVREAIRVANTQPFCDIHDPGPGVGGHCIPYYPYFLIREFETSAPLLQTARDVNDSMPRFTVDQTVNALSKDGTAIGDATVAVLGLTYRPGVDEIRAAPAKGVVSGLSDLGARVLGVDPVLTDWDAFDCERAELADLPEDIDAAVVVTPHDEFDDLDWAAFDPMVVVDGRDTLDLADTDHTVYTLGRGYEGVSAADDDAEERAVRGDGGDEDA
nr:nucleotide sugar dehydrogenase [Halobacterium zhouii]